MERFFEYDIRSAENFIVQLDINILHKLSLISDKEFVLKIYQRNTDWLARLTECTVAKILDLYDIDRDKNN